MQNSLSFCAFFSEIYWSILSIFFRLNRFDLLLNVMKGSLPRASVVFAFGFDNLFPLEK